MEKIRLKYVKDEHLLQYAKENNLVLTNTLFPHKLCHRTTWTSMERIKNHLSSDGKARRNPYRNQIDYIIMKTLHRKLIMDSRSHSGISTPTDHKLVKAKIKLEWWRLNKQFKKSTKLNIDRLRDPVVRKQYQDRLQDKLVKERGNNEHPNDSWNKISKICKETAKETIGIKEPNKTQSSSHIIDQLSKKQRKLKSDAESCRNKKQIIKLKRERNQTIKHLQKELRSENDTALDLELKDIEKYKDDSNKCYQAIQKINSHKPRKPLTIFDNDFKRITSEEDQVVVITDHFSKLFSYGDKPSKPTPSMMDPPYTSEEIEKAAGKLKNKKAVGRDEVQAELIKYGCNELYEQIAKLLNVTSETGNYPEEIRRGLLNPLAKPPKKDEKVNVRPIILISVLRKIITINLRCWDHLKQSLSKGKVNDRTSIHNQSPSGKGDNIREL